MLAGAFAFLVNEACSVKNGNTVTLVYPYMIGPRVFSGGGMRSTVLLGIGSRGALWACAPRWTCLAIRMSGPFVRPPNRIVVKLYVWGTLIHSHL